MIVLNPVEAQQRKSERAYQFNVRTVPLLRCLGYGLVLLLVWVDHRLTPQPPVFEALAQLVIPYCALSWLLLALFFRRLDEPLAMAFLILDVVIYAGIIYATGAEQSWFWVLLVIRAADQSTTTVRRVLFFAHLDAAAYAAVLIVASTHDVRFQWGLGVTKLLGLYMVNLYLSMAARTADAQRRQTTDAIRLAQEQLRLREELAHQNALVWTSAQDGIFSVDAAGRCTLINPAAALMLGYTVEDLTGQAMHGLLHPHDDDDACPLARFTEDGRARTNCESTFRRRDGRQFPVEYSVAPFDDRLIGGVVVFRDITARTELHRMQDEFISIVSHELRTPLTSIQGALGMVNSGKLGQLEPRGQQLVGTALKNVQRLARLVNDILDLERMASGHLRLELAVRPAADLASTAVEAIRSAADAARIHLVLEAAALDIRADGDRVIQVLNNLVGNAIKFSPPDSTVTVSVRRDGADAVFAVTDEGRGIPEGQLESIFKRFAQVDASDARQKGGTGLGLPISRTIVEQHGGRLWAEHRSLGTVFFFSIPLAETQGTPRPVKDQVKNPA